MSEEKWTVGLVAFQDRMPPLAADEMNEAQRKAAAELAAGPRKGVKGSFIPRIRSPELMDRLQKVGEYLRFQSSLEQRISEFIMLIVSREWAQQFEWAADTTYRRTVAAFGENGVVDIVGVVGYFTTVSMVLNVAHTPPGAEGGVCALLPFPF